MAIVCVTSTAPLSRLIAVPFQWTWPGTNNPELMPWVFNLADVMLLTGMLLLLIHLRRRDRRRRIEATSGTDDAAMNPSAVTVPVPELRSADPRDEPPGRE